MQNQKRSRYRWRSLLNSHCSKNYTVHSGDNLYNIAQRNKLYCKRHHELEWIALTPILQSVSASKIVEISREIVPVLVEEVAATPVRDEQSSSTMELESLTAKQWDPPGQF